MPSGFPILRSQSNVPFLSGSCSFCNAAQFRWAPFLLLQKLHQASSSGWVRFVLLVRSFGDSLSVSGAAESVTFESECSPSLRDFSFFCVAILRITASVFFDMCLSRILSKSSLAVAQQFPDSSLLTPSSISTITTLRRAW